MISRTIQRDGSKPHTPFAEVVGEHGSGVSERIGVTRGVESVAGRGGVEVEIPEYPL